MDASAELVRTMLASLDLSAAAVAKRAGVSNSTLHRIVNGQVDPSFGTLHEIAIACGLQLALTTAPLSDPFAASAARSMLEASYEPPNDPGVGRWRERLLRLAGGVDPVEIVKAAANASSPLDRRDATLYSGSTTLARLASAGDASGARWAISGAAGLQLPPDVEIAPTVTILWCEDTHAVDQLLVGSGLRRTDRTDHTSVVVAAAEQELFTGAFTHGLVRYAAPIQIAIDSISQPGPVAQAALAEISLW